MTIAARKGLKPATVNALIEARQRGLWAHRYGLALAISSAGTPSWSYRYTAPDGRRRLMTIAAVNSNEPVTAADLKALELQAETLKLKIKGGYDPLAEREAEEKPERRTTGQTFKQVALAYVLQNKGGWKNAKHIYQWERTLEMFAYPIIGHMPPHEISTDDVLRVLQQDYRRRGKGEKTTLWLGARETASRLRSRIENVISAAKAKGLTDPRTRDIWVNHHNPARWDDNLQHFLNGRQIRSHHEAMDWKEIPAFMTELSGKSDYSAKALILTILCATRTSETLLATWDEFDLDTGVWTIPEERMKAGKEHQIPLPDAAIDLLTNLLRIDGNPYVFPGAKRNRPLSNMSMLEMLRGMRSGLTVHGFRSSFRDWCAETTLHPDAVAEMALAHTISNKVEAAYKRGTMFERRRHLISQWADYCFIESTTYKDKWRYFIA